MYGESQNGCFKKTKQGKFSEKRTCAYQGVRNLCFSEKLACFVFLKHPFWDSPFCLITHDMWEILQIESPDAAQNLKIQTGKCVHRKKILDSIFIFYFAWAVHLGWWTAQKGDFMYVALPRKLLAYSIRHWLELMRSVRQCCTLAI